MATGDIIISGFGDSNVNGIYSLQGTYNGYNYYRKSGTDYYLMYFEKWMPWSDYIGYYIVNIYSIPNSQAVPVMIPKYKKISTNPLDTSVPWISLVGSYSGEYQTGTVVDEDSSSSYSSSSSVSSSSSISSSSSSESSSSSSLTPKTYHSLQI